ncbi:hypothetical protein ScPMuIL_006081 [Solemya velum]
MAVNIKSDAFSSEAVKLVELAIDQLFLEVGRIHKETGKLTDDILSALHSVFQGSLIPALDLVDRRSITCLTGPSGRYIFQVIGSSGTPYTCLSTTHYCSCPAYHYSVLLKEEHLMCKHILAIRLSQTMGLIKHLEVSDKEIKMAILQMD